MKYIALFVFSLALTGCKQQSATPDLDTTKPIRSVKYITTMFQSHTQIRELSGIVQSAQTSPLSFKVGGTVSDLLVSKGQRVEKGQVLAQLETHDLVFALQKARASLGAARVAKLQAEDKYKRSAKLSTKGFVSESELIAIRADLDAKQQQENLAQTDLSNAELNLERAKLYAPFSGQVSQVSIDEFTKVSSGQKIIELVNDFAYEVDFLVPESLISEVYFGEETKVKIPALNDTPFTGTVSEIGAVVERGNAYAVTLQLSESKAELRNGMSAEIQFNIGGSNHGAVLLPIDSFNFNDRDASSEKNNAAIFVVNPESYVIEKRYVEIKRNINAQVVVIGNLFEGEHVVTAGVPYLYEGQQVALWEGL
ncbi:efflux RND transporter periplasmic adaptor subunit [Vibrio splendidus]|nr:efflux RND transporter periplasmic adaptor subunit [Vibrio splendidus]